MECEIDEPKCSFEADSAELHKETELEAEPKVVDEVAKFGYSGDRSQYSTLSEPTGGKKDTKDFNGNSVLVHK
jgi:hypothetical protein